MERHRGRTGARWLVTAAGLAALAACSLRSLRYLDDGTAISTPNPDGGGGPGESGALPMDGAMGDESKPTACGAADAAVCTARPDAGVSGLCDGTFATFATDPNNCGYCGHDCFGGGCDGGVCSPGTLWTEPTEAGLPPGGSSVITVQGGRVYWTTPIDPGDSFGNSRQALRSIATDGGGGARTEAVLPTNPSSVSLDPIAPHAIYFVEELYDPYSQNVDVLTPPSTTPRILGQLTGGSAGNDAISGADFAFDSQHVWMADHSGNIYQLTRTDASLPKPYAHFPLPTYGVVSLPPFVAWTRSPWVADPPKADAAAPTPSSYVDVIDTGTGITTTFGPFVEPISLTAAPALDAIYFYDAWTNQLYVINLCGNTPSVMAAGPPIAAPELPMPTNGILPFGALTFVALRNQFSQLNTIFELGCGRTALIVEPVWGLGGDSYSNVAQDDTALYYGNIIAPMTQRYDVIMKLAKP